MAETKQEVINLREKKTYYATEKNPHVAAGTEVRLHPKTAEIVLKRGYISEDTTEDLTGVSSKKRNDK